MPPKKEVRHILVLESDRVCAAQLTRTASSVFPQAHVQHETEPAAAAVYLAQQEVDFFIPVLRDFDLDLITLLGVWAEHDADRTRTLVVTPNSNSAAVAAARALPICGVFEIGAGDLREFEWACRVIAGGGAYWSIRPTEDEPVARAAAAMPLGLEIADEPIRTKRPGRRALPPSKGRSDPHPRRWRIGPA